MISSTTIESLSAGGFLTNGVVVMYIFAPMIAVFIFVVVRLFTHINR